MRLGVASFLAALIAAPLAAQAAESPARFAVTLRASVADQITYETTRTEEECVIRRSGSGSRNLTLRSVRPTRIEVGSGVIYRPARVVARLTGRANLGAYTELRRCRGAPLERTEVECTSSVLTPRRVRAAFGRPAAHTIVFRKAGSLRADVRVCGLDQGYPGGWLQLAPGRVDEDALLNGRSLRVVARGSATKESTPSPNVTQRTSVRWTLTFRRLG